MQTYAAVHLLAFIFCRQILYLLAQFIHLREVPDSCASQGGRVLHQNHLPLVLVHADHLPVQGPRPDVVEGHATAANVCSRCPPAADCTVTALAVAETSSSTHGSLQNLSLLVVSCSSR